MKGLGWIAPSLAAAGLVGLAGTFMAEQSRFKAAVVGWATRDLAIRTHVASVTLREPLETSDFAAIHSFGDMCSANNVRLTVYTAKGGVFIDVPPPQRPKGGYMYSTTACGEFKIRLGIPVSRVMEPFERAKTGFTLAALASAAGVLLVFLLVYRQSVRIRELKRLEKFRSEFIADFSHEMKTPLTGILGAVDLLDGAAPETASTLLPLIKREAVRLNALAQNILDLAKLERFGVSLSKSPEDPREIIEETVERHAAAAKEAGVELVAPPPSSPLPAVDCDRRLVGQALSNLVGNALRHSGAGRISLCAVAGRKDVRFVVEDDGCGIPPEHAKKVFDRFHRVDPARSAETGGAGLGLSIVRRIARLHGGDVSLENVSPHGCRFVVSLTRSQSSAPASRDAS